MPVLARQNLEITLLVVNCTTLSPVRPIMHFTVISENAFENLANRNIFLKRFVKNDKHLKEMNLFSK